ncbi:T9SS type A sorting domain-containing protein [Subsaximicrobium wynnwilliamsii]|uniref:T9SS type A sorting domain-containing protein n=1 Tax=Subsaximicrobium wynnwilliamsii TaxID=291179 RepID=A0A5C6ZII6_9FLAO|nr:T9SS type A sorting domain-containing protein [Subsaximicrobium wynnwilliamsii]TXD81589.1 T9SS type A sorting domain-containing protein [Subsaximicrobium wynnwilliamsii]TXD89951.1 T9SS type A sorting domain-containing protein [Subsaximicrobium wynnwilliamsii]TXE01050.1 T9SS type A sorting domain-containing protein [Subsaximicrobium wynnwilliamsii]
MTKLFTQIFLLILFSLQINAQTVFTDSFGGELPNSIEIVGNNMFVSTFSTQKLYKLNLDNIDDIETVTNFNGPLWKIRFDSTNNDYYCIVLDNPNSLSVVDLDSNIPITSNILENVTNSNGITINNGVVYVSDNNNLYGYVINSGNYSLVYQESDGNIRNPTVYNNEIYFQVYDTDSNDIYKIDISSQNPTKTLVSTDNNFGILQASLVVNNYIYLGFESPNKIVRINLSELNLPIEPTTIFENLGGGVIGLTNKEDQIYYTTGQQIIYEFSDQVLNNQEFVLSQEKLYPNPAENYITYQSNVNYDLYEIYSITGSLVGNGKFNNSINIEKLVGGLYFIIFKNEQKTKTFKFIKD